MSDSPDLTEHQHGPPGRGAAAGRSSRDHRDVGQDVRGLLAEKEHEIQILDLMDLKLNCQLERAGEEVKKLKEHSNNQSQKIQELSLLHEV